MFASATVLLRSKFQSEIDLVLVGEFEWLGAVIGFADDSGNFVAKNILFKVSWVDGLGEPDRRVGVSSPPQTLGEFKFDIDCCLGFRGSLSESIYPS